MWSIAIKKVFWCMWSRVQSLWYCNICERAIFFICRHTEQVHAQISKRPSFLHSCFYKKIKENSTIGRPNHSQKKILCTVMGWDFTRYQCKRISYNKLGAWIPCWSHIFFHAAMEQLTERLHRNRHDPRRAFELLYFLPCTVEMSECHKECCCSSSGPEVL